MPTTALTSYRDENGNAIEYDGPELTQVKITFSGANNRVVIATPAKLSNLSVSFNCDNGLFTVDEHTAGPSFGGTVRVGQDSSVRIGRNVSSTSGVGIYAVEGTTVAIGDDVMFASQNQLRADDGHPIFDVRTGDRVNWSRDITIGNHVWLAWGVVVLGGATIGDGSVIGYGSLVTRAIPNNCIAAGTPASVIRRDIAWERPRLSMTKPFYNPDATMVTKSPYWHLTDDGARSVGAPPGRPAPRRPLWRRVAGRIRRAARALLGG